MLVVDAMIYETSFSLFFFLCFPSLPLLIICFFQLLCILFCDALSCSINAIIKNTCLKSYTQTTANENGKVLMEIMKKHNTF